MTLVLWGQKKYREYVFLYDAVDSGHPERVRALLNQGVNVNARGYEKDTALIHAVHGYHPKVVRLLLDAGADVNAQDETGRTALLDVLTFSLAFFHTKQPKQWPRVTETLKLLLQAGAHTDLTTADGQSPRQWAELRQSRLKRNPNFYAPLRKKGLADPTNAIRSLAEMVLAKGKGAP
jgi:ankyrin repeat protein